MFGTDIFFPQGIFHPNLVKFKNDEIVSMVLPLCHHTMGPGASVSCALLLSRAAAWRCRDKRLVVGLGLVAATGEQTVTVLLFAFVSSGGA